LRSTRANTTIVSSLAKETGDTSTAGSHRAYSNRRSRENEYSNGELLKEPIYYECGQEEK